MLLIRILRSDAGRPQRLLRQGLRRERALESRAVGRGQYVEEMLGVKLTHLSLDFVKATRNDGQERRWAERIEWVKGVVRRGDEQAKVEGESEAQ
ncbi:MAG: hypothetical protein EHM71_13095 [Zetaproteobacteria bacterium]|nr:MAG: hypothetical protein EHM71_13095 [Zetaproteobacteria bacterium]